MKIKHFYAFPKKEIINNALWIPRWKVTEHKQQHSPVKLIFSWVGREAGSIHPLCGECAEHLIFKENMDIFLSSQNILKWKDPRYPQQSSSKNRQLTERKSSVIHHTAGYPRPPALLKLFNDEVHHY